MYTEKQMVDAYAKGDNLEEGMANVLKMIAENFKELDDAKANRGRAPEKMV